jgi:hypothetical protein
MTALRGARMLAYLFDTPRILRSVRLAMSPLATVLQSFLYVVRLPEIACNIPEALDG